jgi:glycosyltransferase involved in cell wall biosynthesis
MPHRPSLSVVLLNYNHGEFLAEAFTALAEGLRPEHDELIVIDDASQDNSLQILESLRPLFPGFRLVVHQQNQGVIAGMNEGLHLASRQYVYFAASDDRVMPNMFEISLKLLALHPNAAISTARTRIMDKAGRDLGPLKTPVISESPRFVSPQEVASRCLRDDNWLVGSSTIYRRDLLLSAGGFRPELGSYCDGFASRLLAFQHGACFIPEALSCWRRMQEGYSQSETSNIARVTQIADNVTSLLHGPYAADFPAGYAERWRRRWLFGARAHALYGWKYRRVRQYETTEVGWEGVIRPALIGWTKLVWATRLAVLFLRTRPFDVAPTLLRHISYMREVTPEK